MQRLASSVMSLRADIFSLVELLATHRPSWHQLLLAIGGAIGVKVVLSVLWNGFLSPLARQRIPGPCLASFSEVWWSWHGTRFNRAHALHAAFLVSSGC